MRVHAVFGRKLFLDEDEKETDKANTCEVLYHNGKFKKNYWSTFLQCELRNEYKCWNRNLTLDYVILLKVPSKHFSSNDVDIVS